MPRLRLLHDSDTKPAVADGRGPPSGSTVGSTVLSHGRLGLTGDEPDEITVRYNAIMAAGTHCPACKLEIGIWTIVKSSLVGRRSNRCPYCQAKLKYAGGRGMVSLAAGLVIGSLFAANVVMIRSSDRPWIFVLAIVPMLFLYSLPVEYFACLYLRKYKSLAIAKDDGMEPNKKSKESAVV